MPGGVTATSHTGSPTNIYIYYYIADNLQFMEIFHFANHAFFIHVHDQKKGMSEWSVACDVTDGVCVLPG